MGIDWEFILTFIIVILVVAVIRWIVINVVSTTCVICNGKVRKYKGRVRVDDDYLHWDCYNARYVRGGSPKDGI